MDTFVKSAGKTQQKCKKADPTGEQSLNNILWNLSQGKRSRATTSKIPVTTDPQEDMLTDSRRMLPDLACYKEITVNNNKTWSSVEFSD